MTGGHGRRAFSLGIGLSRLGSDRDDRRRWKKGSFPGIGLSRLGSDQDDRRRWQKGSFPGDWLSRLGSYQDDRRRWQQGSFPGGWLDSVWFRSRLRSAVMTGWQLPRGWF